MNGYPCFMDISLEYSMLLWISIWISLDFYGHPCIDLLWILDAGILEKLELFDSLATMKIVFLQSVRRKSLAPVL